MLKKSHIKKVIVTSLLSFMVVPFAFASLSLSGTVDEKAKSNKYSLKNLSSYSKKSFSVSFSKANLRLKSGLSLNPNNNQSANSLLQFGNGNTTYIIPFKYTFKVPKFKTPSPNN